MGQTFRKFDQDGSGELNMQEVAALLKDLGMESNSKAELEEIFGQFDRDHSGAVSFAEFMKWFTAFDAKAVFDKYDTDQSGTLGPDELSKVLKALGVIVSADGVTEAMELLDKGTNAVRVPVISHH